MATLQELESAFMNAHRAGDDRAASVLANAVRTARQSQQQPSYDPTEGMSFFDKAAAGVGKSIYDTGRGIGQMLGMVSREEVDEAKRRDAALMNTGGGITGNIAGNLAQALFIPGGSTVKGAALIGGSMGAVQPVGTDESRLQNIAIGAGLGGATSKGAHMLGDALEARAAAKSVQQAQYAGRDAAIAAGKAEGYVAPSSLTGGGLTSRLAEGLSGKQKTNQAAAIKNQPITESLARRALGLANDAELSPDKLQSLRNQAFQQGYEPIRAVKGVAADAQFVSALDDIAASYTGAAKSFPGAFDSPIPGLVDKFKVNAFDADDALKAMKNLRKEASAAFRAGDNDLALAKREIATALEDQIERHLSQSGKDGAQMLEKFRQARKLIAKTHSVEDALVDGANIVDARKLAQQSTKGRPLDGDLQKIAAFSNATKGSGLTSSITGIPEAGFNTPFSVADFLVGGVLGGTVNPALYALPAARVAARSAILSSPVQQRLGPNYQLGLLSDQARKLLARDELLGLEQLAPNRLAGLLGPAIYAGQE